LKTSLQFTEEQEKAVQKLLAECASIEIVMAMEVDVTKWEEVQVKLVRLTECFAQTSKMIEMAAMIYNTAKGIVANEAMTVPGVLDLKQDLQRNWIAGKLARAEGIYNRVETLLKDLRSQVEGYRSILAFERERIRIENFSQKT